MLNAAGEVLIDQRLEEGLLGGMWSSLGATGIRRINPNRIARELEEELAITVRVGSELITVDHAYSHKKLRFVVHLCDLISGEPQPLASQQVRWVRLDQLKIFPFRLPMRGLLRLLLQLGQLCSSLGS